MDYKDEMRKLIDIVKQQSFTAPLEQTLDDIKTMANAVKDLSDIPGVGSSVAKAIKRRIG